MPGDVEHTHRKLICHQTAHGAYTAESIKNFSHFKCLRLCLSPRTDLYTHLRLCLLTLCSVSHGSTDSYEQPSASPVPKVLTPQTVSDTSASSSPSVSLSRQRQVLSRTYRLLSRSSAPIQRLLWHTHKQKTSYLSSHTRQITNGLEHIMHL